MLHRNRLIEFSLLVVGVMGLATADEAADGLEGRKGKLFKVDPVARNFEFLKETEYDPKTGVGRSRFTVHWGDDLSISEPGEMKTFDGVTAPVVAGFHGIDEDNAEALARGEAFEARVATLYFGAGDEMATGIQSDGRKVFGWFTPGDGEREGILRFGGKQVEVSLRKRYWRIFTETPRTAEDLTKGFWMATLGGERVNGRFVVKTMTVESLPDPRLTDDPTLPRVLVIGDSISMNYHEAAKAALDGVANYHRNEGNAFSVIHGVNSAELWLGNYKQKGFHWDVIQFNHGMHDLKQAYDQESDAFGEYAVPLDEYKQNLEKLIRILADTGAKLIWCSTTPVPNDNKGKYARRAGAEDEFNQAALEVMRDHPEIIVNDLAAVVDQSPVLDAWREQNDVHFYKEDERRVLGEAVAAAVKKALRVSE